MALPPPTNVTPLTLDEVRAASQVVASLVVRLMPHLARNAPVLLAAGRAAKAMIALEAALAHALASRPRGRPPGHCVCPDGFQGRCASPRCPNAR